MDEHVQAPWPIAPCPHAARTILVADDDDYVRALVHATLADGHVVILEAPSGAEALALARGHGVDLALLDVVMSGVDGLAVCRALKADPATARTKVVMLTARAADRDRAQGLAAGADAYVTKPFSPKALLDLVSGLLAT